MDAFRHIRHSLMQQRWAFGLGFLLLTLTTATAAMIPYLLKVATESLLAMATEGRNHVVTAAVGLVALALLNAAFRVNSRTYIYRIGRQIEYDLRRTYHAKLLELDAAFFNQAKTGDLVARGTNDILAVRMFVGPGFLQIVSTGMIYTVTLPIMFSMNPLLATLALAPLPLVILVARRLTGRLYQLSRGAADRFGVLSGFIQESMTSMTVIRNHHQADNWMGRFQQEAHALYAAQLRHARMQSLFGPLMLLSGGLGGLIILGYGGRMVIAGEMTLGDFVAFSGYLSQLIWPTVGLGWILTILQRGLAALDRIGRILDTQPGLQLVAEPPTTDPKPGAIPPGAMVIQDLHFAFADGARRSPPEEILGGISLTIPTGAWVGLIGRVGAGKSVLLNCLARLHPVADGMIQIDGQELNRIPESELRQLVAMTPQESYLFSTTVRENLLYGRPDAPEEVAWSCARQASLDAEIQGFPKQMTTVVGERGITLSGGQRQRLALARALAMETPILLLDDIFSSVDARTEEAILVQLRQLVRNRTMLMVCHRVAALHQADFIAVLDQGKLLAIGDHRELMATCGLYRDLHQQMARAEALEKLQ